MKVFEFLSIKEINGRFEINMINIKIKLKNSFGFCLEYGLWCKRMGVEV